MINENKIEDYIFSLREKLEHARSRLHADKNLPFPVNSFSKSDFAILENLLFDSDISQSTACSIKALKSTKFLYYFNKNILTSILSCELLKEYDRHPCKKFTKWFNFSNNAEEKINTIKSNQLYADFSEKFNDIFDSKIKCSNVLLKDLSNKFKTQDQPLPIDFIEFLQLFFSCANICCLSLLDPLKTDSSNMWGLYGDSGQGVAIEYDAKELYYHLAEMNKKKNGHYYHFYPVNYINKSCHYEFLGKFLEYKIKNLAQMPDNVLKAMHSFYSTKLSCWSHEKEIRIISFEFITNGAQPNHPLNCSYHMDNQETVIGLLEQAKSKHQKELVGIKPSKIILGWKNNNSKKLIDYAHQNSIEIIKLNDSFDYRTDEFEYKRL